MNLLDMKKSDIKILQLLKSGDEIRYVEFHSYEDKRDRILNVESFCEIFGYTIEDLVEMECTDRVHIENKSKGQI